MRSHPYSDKDPRTFWRTAVSDRRPMLITDWYRRKFDIGNMKIATAGSCFAQHIGRALKAAGYPFVDTEPPPPGLAPEHRQSFGFGMYSARYGNVYTSRQLVQLFQRSVGDFIPELSAWPHRGGFVDPFRPAIEPDPFATIEELETNRRAHLLKVRGIFGQADLLIFTLGLTECWCARHDGAALPLAPGVAGGVYEPSEYQFVNLSMTDVVADMETLFKLARRRHPNMHFILTVSPVPLAATATNEHVIVATTYSKSVLRAACGELVSRHNFVDYFPSFEIISSHPMRGEFYAANGRDVRPEGVAHVMKHFFSEHPAQRATGDKALDGEADWERAACEEELLAAAARRS